jgi:3-oxoacyl-[acyl-carrier protein] reductase
MSSKKRKAVLITGGSRGIGRAISLKFSQEVKAPIIVNYSKNDQKANELVAQIKAAGGEAYALQCDVSDASAVKDMYGKIRDMDLWVHTLINNAGITKDKLAVQMDDSSWSDVIDTNLNGTFNCIKAALTPMIAHRSGSIVNISSIAGTFGQLGQANYCASKGGVIALTKSLARELGPMNIRVNCVAPGFIDTEMVDTAKQNEAMAEHLQLVIKNLCAMGRIGQASEVANVVYMIAHKDNSYMTGQTIVVDGGMTM